VEKLMSEAVLLKEFEELIIEGCSGILIQQLYVYKK